MVVSKITIITCRLNTVSSATPWNYFLYRHVMNIVNRHSNVKVIHGLISAGLNQEHTKLILMFPLYESIEGNEYGITTNLSLILFKQFVKHETDESYLERIVPKEMQADIIKKCNYSVKYVIFFSFL